jgi:hypothetical protein
MTNIIALTDRRWFYEVPIVNQKTGERKTVVIQLTEFERLDLLQYEAFHPGHTGGPDGPIANAYAMRHADKKAPAGFVPVCDEIERVTLQ